MNGTGRTNGGVGRNANLGGAARSPLDTLVAMTLRTAVFDPGDNFSSLAVAEAIEELLALDPQRRGSWRLRGMAEGYDLFAASHAGPTPDLDRARLAGVLEAAADLGDHERIGRIAADEPTTVATLVARAETMSVAAVLTAILQHDPDHAVRLAGEARDPFPSWQHFVEAVVSHVEQGCDDDAGRALLHAVTAVLERWAASTPRGAKALGEAIFRLREALA